MSKLSLTSFIDNVHMLMCMNDKFSLTSFICWCERINKFSLTSFHCSQQYNCTADEKKTTTRQQFRFFIKAHAYLTREKRLLVYGLGWALLMQYDHSKRHMNQRWWVRPWATQRRSQYQGFASNLVQELREEDEFSQLFPFTTIRFSKHHNNKTAVCPQFPYFLWQVFLVDPYRQANSAMWHFFPCQVHLFKSYHASFWTSALVKEKIDKVFFTH